jgi:hypothetical protein
MRVFPSIIVTILTGAWICWLERTAQAKARTRIHRSLPKTVVTDEVFIWDKHKPEHKHKHKHKPGQGFTGHSQKRSWPMRSLSETSTSQNTSISTNTSQDKDSPVTPKNGRDRWGLYLRQAQARTQAQTQAKALAESAGHIASNGCSAPDLILIWDKHKHKPKPYHRKNWKIPRPNSTLSRAITFGLF